MLCPPSGDGRIFKPCHRPGGAELLSVWKRNLLVNLPFVNPEGSLWWQRYLALGNCLVYVDQPGWISGSTQLLVPPHLVPAVVEVGVQTSSVPPLTSYFQSHITSEELASNSQLLLQTVFCCIIFHSYLFCVSFCNFSTLF